MRCSVSRSSLMRLQACSTVVWSRPPKASPISGRLCVGEFFRERHRHLARARDRAAAALGEQIRDAHLEVVGDGLLDVLDRDELRPAATSRSFKRFLRELERDRADR